jgi:hypothetical protein
VICGEFEGNEGMAEGCDFLYYFLFIGYVIG